MTLIHQLKWKSIGFSIFAIGAILIGIVLWTDWTTDPRVKELRYSYGISLTQKCMVPCNSSISRTLGNNPILLKDLIEKLGPPQKIAAFMRSGGENLDLVIYLYYINRGFSFLAIHHYKPPSNVRIEITPDMEIAGIDIWSAYSIDGIIGEMKKLKGTATLLEQSQDWFGFGPTKLLDPY